MTPANLAWLIAYLCMLGGIVYGLNSYRSSAIAKYQTEDAGADWKEWRDAVGEMDPQGPVQRRVPKSVAPPPLVLMQDHFPACLGISLLLSSCLFVWFMFSARGAFRPVVLHEDD